MRSTGSSHPQKAKPETDVTRNIAEYMSQIAPGNIQDTKSAT